jgi:hypothetical protein
MSYVCRGLWSVDPSSWFTEKITRHIDSVHLMVATNYGSTALHSAAENGHKAVVRLLLEKGADVAAKDKIGMTAPYDATRNGKEAIVRLLITSQVTGASSACAIARPPPPRDSATYHE